MDYDYNIIQMRLQIEELTIKLEEKSMMLNKAKSQIDTLTGETIKLRLEKDRAIELDERLAKSKKANDDMNQQYHSQFVQLEADLISARYLYTSKSNEYIEMSEKLAKVEISNKVLQSQLDESNKEKENVKVQLMTQEHRYNELEDEITQCRAHVELYKLQYDESLDELKKYQSKLTQADEQIKTIDSNHVVELEKLETKHNESIEETKRNYLRELEEMNEYMKMQLKKNRDDDIKEFNLRIQEKKEEIKNLRSLIDKDKLHTEALMRELEAFRVELRIKTEILDEYRKDIGVKVEEVQVLRRVSEQVSEQNIKLKETLSHLQMEKGVLTTRFEQVTTRFEQVKHDYDAANENLLRLQAANTTFNSENSSLKKEIVNLRLKCDLVEEIGRENERLKMINMSLKGNNQDLTKDLTNTKEDLKKWYSTAIKANDDLGFYENQFTSMTLLKEELEVQVNEQKEKIRIVEAAFTEAKNNSVELRHSLLESTNNVNILRNSRKELLGICNLISEIIPSWDDILTNLLDGSKVNSFIIESKTKKKSTFKEIDNFNNDNDNETHEPSNVKQDVILGIERIKMKMDRALKIRSNFDNQCKKLIEALMSSSSQSELALQLVNHRLNEANSKLIILQKAIDRDQKLREEFQNFKEKVMREQEEKYNDVCIQLESKRNNEDMHIKQIESLTSTVDAQALKLHDYDEIKIELQSVTNRLNDIVDRNNYLSKELDTKSSMLLTTTTELNDIKNLRLEEKNNDLIKEIEQLRKRQIDPELASQIRQTQSMIQESVLQDRSPSNFMNERNFASSTASSPAYEVSEVINSANILVNRIAEIMNRFENYQSRNGTITFENGNLISQFEQDLFILIEQTSRMSLQIQILTSEFRKTNISKNGLVDHSNGIETRSKLFSSSSVGSSSSSTPINRIIIDNKSSAWGDNFSSSVGLGGLLSSSNDDREGLEGREYSQQSVQNNAFNDIVFHPSSSSKLSRDVPLNVFTEYNSNLSYTYPYASSPKYSINGPPRRSPPKNNNLGYDKSPKLSSIMKTSVPKRTINNKLEVDLKLLSKKLDNLNNSNFI